MIKVGDLVKVREGSDLDCDPFDNEVGLVVKSDYYEHRVGGPREIELLVEWCGRPVSLWENPEHLEKFNEKT
tara:strand:+ start:815 stop:1030 length:216 start_codon:yes stop_codon:yes gene_type:complete